VRGVALAGVALAIAVLAGCTSATGAHESPVSPGAPAEGEPAPDGQLEGGPPPNAPLEPSTPSQPSRAPDVGGVVQGARASTFELLAREGEAARVLRIVVDDVESAPGQNPVLVVSATLPSAAIELGRLAFYPANRGGTFVLPLPTAVAAHVDASRGLSVRCALELEGPAGSSLEAVRARVRSLVLMPAP